MKNIIFNIISGVLIGIANVIPGVSGGTIAVVCGVYPSLLKVSSLDISAIKEDKKNITALMVGVMLGFMIFAKVIIFLYSYFPYYTSFFFVGIVLGSIPFLFNLTKSKQNLTTTVFIKLISFLVGITLMLSIFIMQLKFGNVENQLITTLNFKITIWLFALGIISATAMLIPGISGSFLLLILGGYKTVMSAVADLNIIFILPFVLGVGIGLILTSKLLTNIIKTYPQIIYSFIFGLVMGSIPPIIPLGAQTIIGYTVSVIAVICGAVLVFLFTKLGNKINN